MLESTDIVSFTPIHLPILYNNVFDNNLTSFSANGTLSRYKKPLPRALRIASTIIAMVIIILIEPLYKQIKNTQEIL